MVRPGAITGLARPGDAHTVRRMDIIIAGGHGKIAQLLGRRLAEGGHRVRGLIRSPAQAAALEALGVIPVVADLEHTDVEALAVQLGAADTIVFAAGSGEHSGPERDWTVDFGAAVTLIAVAQRNRICRYIMVSGRGADEDAPDDGGFGTYLRAKGLADSVLADSSLDFTIVRPVALSDAAGMGTVATGDAIGDGPIARADVASVVATLVTTRSALGSTFVLGPGPTPIFAAVAALPTTAPGRAARPYAYDAAVDRHVDGASARFTYRRLGRPGGVPLLLAMRFRGTIDHWDPAFLEPLAAEREVIVFDNAGINASTGTTPTTIGEMADGLLDFADALGLARVDLLGWSMGGAVVQAAALQRPGLVRRLVSAGSGPGGVPGTPAIAPEILQVATRPTNDDEDFLTLFYPRTGAARAAGLASLRRLDRRLLSSRAGVAAPAWSAQLQAIGTWAAGRDSAWQRLGELTMPVLAANGVHDVMAAASSTAAMAERLPSGAVLFYSDAGHAFLFQHPRAFAAQVNAFLST